MEALDTELKTGVRALAIEVLAAEGPMNYRTPSSNESIGRFGRLSSGLAIDLPAVAT